MPSTNSRQNLETKALPTLSESGSITGNCTIPDEDLHTWLMCTEPSSITSFSRQKTKRSYSTKDSLVVNDPTTNLALEGFVFQAIVSCHTGSVYKLSLLVPSPTEHHRGLTYTFGLELSIRHHFSAPSSSGSELRVRSRRKD